jgi:HD-GYP domain-containing protein (c-di-GMP phosphodiesterase class II)
MRYVTIPYLKDGMILGRTLLSNNFSPMMSEGMVLDASRIERINNMGYSGIYVADEFSAGIMYHDVVKFETRADTVKAASELMTQVENGHFRQGVRVTRVRQERIVRPVMEEIIASPKRIMDIIDLKPYDGYNHYHTANVVVLSLLVGIELGLSGNQLYDLGLAALVYDIGNVFIPKYFLEKRGKLTPEEYEVIRKHTDTGFEYLREHFDISIEACMGALHHHEFYDGSGYPNGLKKDKISIYGRVIAITDVFDALTSRRPFRQAMYPCTAMEFVNMNTGKMFDPAIAKAFNNVVASYPSGVFAELTTGVTCFVESNTPSHGDRPKVRMMGGMSNTPLTVDLARDRMFAGVGVSHILDAG